MKQTTNNNYQGRLVQCAPKLKDFDALLSGLDDESPYKPFYQEMRKVLDCAKSIPFDDMDDTVDTSISNILTLATKLINMTQKEVSDSDFEHEFMPIATEMAKDAVFLLGHKSAEMTIVDMKKDPLRRLATACLGGLLVFAAVVTLLTPALLVGLSVIVDAVIEPLFGYDYTMQLHRYFPAIESETIDKLMSPTVRVEQTAKDVLGSVQNSVQSFQEKLAVLKSDGEESELKSGGPTTP